MGNDYKKTSCEHRRGAPHKNSHHLKDACAPTEQAQPWPNSSLKRWGKEMNVIKIYQLKLSKVLCKGKGKKEVEDKNKL